MKQTLIFFVIVQLVFDVMVAVVQTNQHHGMTYLPQQEEAKAFVAEQLAPFEKAAKETELQKRAAELQEEFWNLHPEQRPPVALPEPTQMPIGEVKAAPMRNGK